MSSILEGLPVEGTRIELEWCDDPWTRLQPGSRGTVTGRSLVNPPLSGRPHAVGQLSVRWDDGSSLMLIDGHDRWKVIQGPGQEDA